MNALVTINDGLTMSSHEIAELTGSTHDNVLKTIRRLASEGIVSANETPYKHPQNGQTYLEFLLSFRDTMVVVSGYSAELRARIIDRWQELEARIVQPTIPAQLSRLQLIELAMQAEQERLVLEEKANKLEIKVFEQAPKVEALARIARADGWLNMTSAAKNLGVPPRKLMDWMNEHRWIYRRPGGSGWVAYQDRIQSGYLSHKIHIATREDGSEKTCEQVMILPKGLAKLAEAVPPSHL